MVITASYHPRTCGRPGTTSRPVPCAYDAVHHISECTLSPCADVSLHRCGSPCGRCFYSMGLSTYDPSLGRWHDKGLHRLRNHPVPGEARMSEMLNQQEKILVSVENLIFSTEMIPPSCATRVEDPDGSSTALSLMRIGKSKSMMARSKNAKRSSNPGRITMTRVRLQVIHRHRNGGCLSGGVRVVHQNHEDEKNSSEFFEID
jgi:hypothetical protein